MPLRPMLASDADLSKISYPVLVSPKLDGVRATVQGGELLSRTLKPIPNEYTRELLKHKLLEGLDGELIVGSPVHEHVWNNTQSGVMSRGGKPDVAFYVFDKIHPTMTFRERHRNVKLILEQITEWAGSKVRRHGHAIVKDERTLMQTYNLFVKKGYEGLIIRSIDGLYKHGRSTVREGGMLKLKLFSDSEARIEDFIPLFKNANTQTRNALGLAERSSKKENLIQTDSLGAFVVTDIHSGIRFKIGSGFTEEQREEFWLNRHALEGKLVRYKYLSAGVLVAPRHPVFQGFRSQEDI